MIMPCRKPELYQYSPHQGRMLLLDQINSYCFENFELESLVEVTDESEFYDSASGIVPVWVSFEYVAQSIAVLSGISHRQKGGDPKIGFIMGVRDFDAHVEGFKAGDRVSVHIKQSFRDGDVAVFEGDVAVNGTNAASVVVNVIEHNQDLMDRWA